ncbi:MAG TPA: hypothetical protein VN611_18330 [Patescibacteria group bacterium]|nr:hypothetical protein [Patescibacteria group bacterium]
MITDGKVAGVRWQKLLLYIVIVTAAGLFWLGGALWFAPSAPPPSAGQPSAPPSPAAISPRSVAVKNYGNWAELRDPFRYGGSAGYLTAAGPAVAEPATLAARNGSNSLPVLTGVVLGGEPVAIMRWAGKSQAYKIRERIGDYTVIAIDASSVILAGSAGSHTLVLGR